MAANRREPAINADLPVAYWPAYLPSSDAVRAAPVPYRLTPLAEMALAAGDAPTGPRAGERTSRPLPPDPR